jgi:hypothetical protein
MTGEVYDVDRCRYFRHCCIAQLYTKFHGIYVCFPLTGAFLINCLLSLSAHNLQELMHTRVLPLLNKVLYNNTIIFTLTAFDVPAALETARFAAIRLVLVYPLLLNQENDHHPAHLDTKY